MNINRPQLTEKTPSFNYIELENLHYPSEQTELELECWDITPKIDESISNIEFFRFAYMAWNTKAGYAHLEITAYWMDFDQEVRMVADFCFATGGNEGNSWIAAAMLRNHMARKEYWMSSDCEDHHRWRFLLPSGWPCKHGTTLEAFMRDWHQLRADWAKSHHAAERSS